MSMVGTDTFTAAAAALDARLEACSSVPVPASMPASVVALMTMPLALDVSE